MKKKNIYMLSGLSILFIIITILVVCGFTGGFDTYIYNLVRSISSNGFDKFFKFITGFGDTPFVIGLVLGLIIILRSKFAYSYIGLIANCALTNQIIKFIVRRDRPDVLKLIEQGGYSYPSGHSMVSMCMYGYLVYLANKTIKNKYLRYFVMGSLSLLILLIGISRIYVGVHFATDVIAGFILGFIELCLFINISNKYIFRGK